MEPKLPTPSSPEMGGYRRPEMPKVPEYTPEKNMGSNAEHAERHEVEQQAPSTPAGVTPQVVVQLPSIPAPVPSAQPQSTQPPVDDNPIVAADEDLIEKEWVTKAKQVVQNTKSDPYQQENEVSKLQADYLKKRYGKDVKLSSS